MSIRIELIYGDDPQHIYMWKHAYQEPVTVAQVVEDSHVCEIYNLECTRLFYAIFSQEVDVNHRIENDCRVSVLRPTIRNGRQR